MPNIEDAEYVERDGPPGFRARRARIGRELGSELVGASLWEVPPGEAAYPYHFHYGEDEIVIVLAGRPSLRTPGGVRELEQGEAVRFAPGEEGAHQVFNPTEETVRFLAVSNQGPPEVVIYPDSGKVGASDRDPGGEGFNAYYKLADEVDYWDGETPPRA